MFKYTKSTLQLTRTVQRSALKMAQSRVLQCRMYASSNKEAPKKQRRSLVPLAILGIAALGLTYYNMGHVSKPPRASVDPVSRPKKDIESKEQPLFKDNEISVIYVLGGPGAGKGTQSAKLVKEYGFVHLSAGDLLRAEQKDASSKYGELIANYIKEGRIVPQEITVALLRKAIVNNYNQGKTKFLVDGFPRKMDQALAFENQIAHGKFVLFFQCPEDVMLHRLLERGKTSGRSDDNMETIRKRFHVFEETSMPVVDYFEKQGKVLKVSCDHPVDVVFGQVVAQLKKEGITD
ncbi:DEBR0S2_03004g1_1 [Brettanomyces bruxellensis]|uniref:Uridylate kinase n=2 Tax=Dekkera bruxellensis TaxID=5007 RepID=A0A7D9GYR9_DEKBR|nr:DEBR0S2_03004g1_1 [Brettanomyces bruxellensis]